MYPAEFAPVLRDLLRGSHPDIANVETFDDANYTHKPVGVLVTMTDGTSFAIGIVGTAPPGGDAARHPDSVAWRENLKSGT
jgi:hypothetical protein